MTVQNGRCRDGGWEDAAGQPPDFRYSGHHQKRGQRYPRTRRDGGKDGGGTVERMVAGRWKGWWRDDATEGLLKVMIFREI